MYAKGFSVDELPANLMSARLEVLRLKRAVRLGLDDEIEESLTTLKTYVHTGKALAGRVIENARYFRAGVKLHNLKIKDHKNLRIVTITLPNPEGGTLNATTHFYGPEFESGTKLPLIRGRFEALEALGRGHLERAQGFERALEQSNDPRWLADNLMPTLSKVRQ